MDCFSSATEELDKLQVRVALEESEAQRRELFDSTGQSAYFKAGCVVWSMAILEVLFKDLAPEIRRRVRAQCSESEVLHADLALALDQGAWRSAASVERRSVLRRLDVLNSHVLGTDDWPESFSFHDGKTVDDNSFLLVWRVMRLRGPVFPGGLHAATLKDLSGRRNRVAHGEETVLDSGRAISFPDLARKLLLVDEAVSHMFLAVDEWVATGGWRV